MNKKKRVYRRHPKQRKRTGLTYYLVEIIIHGGSMVKEHLRSVLFYPPCFNRVVRRAAAAGYFTIYYTKKGLELIKLNDAGYRYVLRFKKRKPIAFENLFSERLIKMNITIDEEHKFSWGVANFDMYEHFDALDSWYKKRRKNR